MPFWTLASISALIVGFSRCTAAIFQGSFTNVGQAQSLHVVAVGFCSASQWTLNAVAVRQGGLTVVDTAALICSGAALGFFVGGWMGRYTSLCLVFLFSIGVFSFFVRYALKYGDSEIELWLLWYVLPMVSGGLVPIILVLAHSSHANSFTLSSCSMLLFLAIFSMFLRLEYEPDLDVANRQNKSYIASLLTFMVCLFLLDSAVSFPLRHGSKHSWSVDSTRYCFGVLGFGFLGYVFQHRSAPPVLSIHGCVVALTLVLLLSVAPVLDGLGTQQECTAKCQKEYKGTVDAGHTSLPVKAIGGLPGKQLPSIVGSLPSRSSPSDGPTALDPQSSGIPTREICSFELPDYGSVNVTEISMWQASTARSLTVV